MTRCPSTTILTFERIVHTPSEAAALLASGCGCEDQLAAAPSTFSVANPEAPESECTWAGTIVVEGELTGDGRMMQPDSLRWDTLPIALRWAPKDEGGHDGAQVVGRILTITRAADGQIQATGDFDMGSPIGYQAARQVDEGLTPGISVDLDSVEFEILVAKEIITGDDWQSMESRLAELDPEATHVPVYEGGPDDEIMCVTAARIRAATMVAIPAFESARITLTSALPEQDADGDGDGDTEPTQWPHLAADGLAFSIEPCTDAPEDSICLHEGCTVRPTMSVSTESCDVNALYCAEHATIHEYVAYANGVITERNEAAQAVAVRPATTTSDRSIDAALTAIEESLDPDAALVAGGFPVEPPGAWFSQPTFDAPTPLTIDKTGRVYGHMAVWGTCHTAYTGQCVEPPHSKSEYAYFRTGSVLTKEGSEVPVGRITLGTGHAGPNAGAADAMAHYDNTGRAVADVAAGEDIFGIWVAGALRPGVTAEQVRALRSSPLSGDWRRIGTALELVATLAVNSPGFPIPRPKGLVASGVVTSLVASGMIAPFREPTVALGLSPDDLQYLKRVAARERRAEAEERLGLQSKADALAARLRATKVAQMAARLSGE